MAIPNPIFLPKPANLKYLGRLRSCAYFHRFITSAAIAVLSLVAFSLLGANMIFSLVTRLDPYVRKMTGSVERRKISCRLRLTAEVSRSTNANVRNEMSDSSSSVMQGTRVVSTTWSNFEFLVPTNI